MASRAAKAKNKRHGEVLLAIDMGARSLLRVQITL